MSEHNEGMINIWSLVGYILVVYGVIITGCGIYYKINGTPETVMGSLNPSLWWGMIILASGIIFTFIGKKGQKKEA